MRKKKFELTEEMRQFDKRRQIYMYVMDIACRVLNKKELDEYRKELIEKLEKTHAL